MKVKVFLVLLLTGGFLILESSVLAQSPKGQLIQMMRNYVGMVNYDGATFFLDEIKGNGGSEIRLKSYDKFANPNQLFLNLAKIKSSSLAVKRILKPGSGEFERYEVRFQGLGSVYEIGHSTEPFTYTDINICLAGKELYTPTTYDHEIADSLLVLFQKAIRQAKNIKKAAPVKTYKIVSDKDLEFQILNTQEVSFLANNRSGGYITLSGGMKEFFGAVNSVCVDFITQTPLTEVHPDIALPVTYILVRNYEGKRETVAEIPDTLSKQSGSNTCCRTCLKYPDRETFPSGAYEVFIYLGESQNRKMGNFMFAVK